MRKEIKVLVQARYVDSVLNHLGALGYTLGAGADKLFALPPDSPVGLYCHSDGVITWVGGDGYFHLHQYEEYTVPDSFLVDTPITAPECPPLPIKDSNPKDAIGDTKVPMALLSPVAKAHWALAQFAGATKYGRFNYRKSGVRSSVYLSAMERHLMAYAAGEDFDPVDGSHHLGNVMACCAIILESQACGVLTDDRGPSIPFRQVWRDVEEQMAVLKEQYADKAPKHYTIQD